MSSRQHHQQRRQPPHVAEHRQVDAMPVEQLLNRKGRRSCRPPLLVLPPAAAAPCSGGRAGAAGARVVVGAGRGEAEAGGLVLLVAAPPRAGGNNTIHWSVPQGHHPRHLTPASVGSLHERVGWGGRLGVLASVWQGRSGMGARASRRACPPPPPPTVSPSGLPPSNGTCDACAPHQTTLARRRPLQQRQRVSAWSGG